MLLLSEYAWAFRIQYAPAFRIWSSFQNAHYLHKRGQRIREKSIFIITFSSRIARLIWAWKTAGRGSKFIRRRGNAVLKRNAKQWKHLCGCFNIQYNYSSASTAGFHTVEKKDQATGLFTGNLCTGIVSWDEYFFQGFKNQIKTFCITAYGFHNICLPICGEKNWIFW